MAGSASFQRVCPADLEMCECTDGLVDHDAPTVEGFLELDRGGTGLTCS